MKNRSLQDLLAERRANLLEAMRTNDPITKAMLHAHVDTVIDVELARRRDNPEPVTLTAAPNGFVHVQERTVDDGGDADRFSIQFRSRERGIVWLWLDGEVIHDEDHGQDAFTLDAVRLEDPELGNPPVELCERTRTNLTHLVDYWLAEDQASREEQRAMDLGDDDNAWKDR